MPTMDEYTRSGGYVRDASLSGNTSNFTFSPGYSGGSSGGGSSMPNGYITPGKAGGEKTTSNPTVYPIAAPETAAGSLLGKVGIKSSDDMITIALFGGLVILFMSLFKG